MMFTEKQIKFMRQQGINVDFTRPLNDEDLDLIDDRISHLLQAKGFDRNYNPTAIGAMAESIMDKLATM